MHLTSAKSQLPRLTLLCGFALLTGIVGGLPDVAAWQSEVDGKGDSLLKQQDVYLQQMAELENRLLKLSEFELDRNPERADLLRKGLELSQSSQILRRLQESRQLIQSDRTTDLKSSVAKQVQVLEDLQRLYDLLQSENPQRLNRDRQQVLRRRIDQIEQMIRRQQGLRERLDVEQDVQRIGKDQNQLREATGQLRGEIESEVEQQTDAEGDGNESGKDKPEDLDQGVEPGDPGDANRPTDGESTMPQSEEEKIVARLRSASQKMKDVTEQLEKQQSSPSGAETDVAEADTSKSAGRQMEQAEESLALAKLELEEMLRQRREEEISSALRSLEERFKQMLTNQLKINEATTAIKMSEQSQSEKNIEAFGLATEEKKISLEIEKALLVLKEEGSTRAIPGTLMQAQSDLLEIIDRLEQGRLDSETLFLQTEVAETFENLVDAVQKEQKEQEQRRKQSRPAGDLQPETRQLPLVQKIAELKIIRQLQARINERHARFATRLNSGVEDKEKTEISRLTKKLGERQKQLEQITRELIQEETQ